MVLLCLEWIQNQTTAKGHRLHKKKKNKLHYNQCKLVKLIEGGISHRDGNGILGLCLGLSKGSGADRIVV